MNKIGDFLKKYRKNVIIIGIILVLLISGLVLYLTIFNNAEQKTSSKSENKIDEEKSAEDKLVAPAKNTEDLLDELSVVNVQNISSNEIIFSNDFALKEGEKIAVWVYSEPKFLGYFEVIIKDGVKKIEGLLKALENIEIETGKHHLAIVTEKGEEIGYVDVFLNKNGLSKNEVADSVETEKEEEKEQEQKQTQKVAVSSKTITEKNIINFKTTVLNEINMKKGDRKVVQAGSNGEMQVVYKVTYDQNGNELSKEKVKESIIKQAVEQIEKVGVSDYNLNTDRLTEVSFGPACNESQVITDASGYKECDSLNNPNLPEYYAVKINTTYYITSIKEGGREKLSSPIKVTGTDGTLLKAPYKGMQYYFYMSGGGGQYEPLTSDICSKYKLSCGAW